jgi:hypothetical protein
LQESPALPGFFVASVVANRRSMPSSRKEQMFDTCFLAMVQGIKAATSTSKAFLLHRTNLHATVAKREAVLLVMQRPTTERAFHAVPAV